MRARLLRVSKPTRPRRATMTPRLPPGWGQTSQLVSWSGESGAPVTCAGAESSAVRRLGRVSAPPAEGRCRHESRCRPLPPPSKRPLTPLLPPRPPSPGFTLADAAASSSFTGHHLPPQPPCHIWRPSPRLRAPSRGPAAKTAGACSTVTARWTWAHVQRLVGVAAPLAGKQLSGAFHVGWQR